MLCNCTRFEFDLKLIGNCSETASNSYQNRQCLRIWMKQCWFLEWNNYRRMDSGRFSDALHFRRAAACCMNNKEKIAASGTALGTPFSQLNVWEMEEKKKRPTIKINSSGTARKLHWNPRNWTSSYKSQVFKIPLETLMELPSKCSVVALYFRMVPRRNKTARKLLLKCSGTALEGNTSNKTTLKWSESPLLSRWAVLLGGRRYWAAALPASAASSYILAVWCWFCCWCSWSSSLHSNTMKYQSTIINQ